MFLLISTALCVKPLILIPGLFGSQLYTTYGKDFAQEWYCTKTAKNKVAWVNPSYLIPPRYNCLFNMLAVVYNTTAKNFESKPGLQLYPDDFGGVDGISTLIEAGDIRIIESFSHMVAYMKARGYVVGETLFGVPYDWRLAYVGLHNGTLNADLLTLVTRAYNASGGQRVTILGYSLGSIISTQFLGNYLTAAARTQYVEKAIFLAPAFAGAGDAVAASWALRFPIAEFLESKYIEEAVRNMPCVHVLFPNYIVYSDTAVIRRPDGTYVYADGVIDFLAEQGKLTGDSLAMARLNEEMILKKAPVDPMVPVMFIYNSGLSTKMGLNFKNGYNNEPVKMSVAGDGTVPAKGIQWACRNFGSTVNPVLCYDMDTSDPQFNHMGLGDNSYVNELIYNYTNIKNWHLKGKSAFYTPIGLTKTGNTTYRVESVLKKVIEK